MIRLFGIPLYSESKDSFRALIRKDIEAGRRVTVATVNPEILLTAKKDDFFADALRACSYRVVDGFGISFVAFFKQRKKVPRITGRDVVRIFYEFAVERQLTVGLVGGSAGVAARAAKALTRMYPTVRTVDLSEGKTISVSREGNITAGEDVVRHAITTHQPHILLLGFGAPKQEYLMIHDRFQSNTLLQVGIGGLLDVFGGSVATPPRIFSRMGVEWLWRLCVQPWRFTRIVNAVMVFTITAMLSKEKNG